MLRKLLSCLLSFCTPQEGSAPGTHPQHPSHTSGPSYANAAGGGKGSSRPSSQQPSPSSSSHKIASSSSNVYVRSFFFPSESSFSELQRALSSARSTIDVCVFTITDDDIANVLIQAHRRGIKVRVISDNDQAASRGSDIAKLASHGIPVRVDPTPAHMHNKFAVVDGNVLISGSYNWTKGARRDNNENIIITNSGDAVSSFSQEFNKLWNQFDQQQ